MDIFKASVAPCSLLLLSVGGKIPTQRDKNYISTIECWHSHFQTHNIFVDYTLWLFNIAMKNGPVIDGLPIKNCDFPWLC